VSDFATSAFDDSKGKAAKPTKMYVRGGIVKKKGLHRSIGNLRPCFATRVIPALAMAPFT
jgi:hypothetical protein